MKMILKSVSIKKAEVTVTNFRFFNIVYAPDWTRTSTSIWTQALNLPCIPIPPQGQLSQCNEAILE